MSAYRLTSLDDARFAVADAENEIQFVGTLAECEEWLDRGDQVRTVANETASGAAVSPPVSWWSRLWQALLGR
jgi:hypothetical protein